MISEAEKAELIAQANANIQIMEISLKNCCSDYKNDIERDLRLNRIALVALTSEPVVYQENWAGDGWKECSKSTFNYLTEHPVSCAKVRALIECPPAK